MFLLNPTEMKSLKVSSALFLFFSFVFTSCSPDHDFLSSTNEIITRGSWNVEFFANDNKTAELGSLNFQFNGNGKLSATNGVTTVQGSWNVIKDVDRSDVLTINMNEQGSVSELSNTWSVKTKTTNNFILQAKGSTTEFRLRKL